MSTNAGKALGIITARGGSKGVPNKNIKILNGKPLINYTAELALACPYISTLVTTTDSETIREKALACGSEAPFLRPAELATDTAKQEDAILHAMEWYENLGHTYDYVILLEPTSPLRTMDNLMRGFEILETQPKAEAVFSIIETHKAPYVCNTLRKDGSMREWIDEKYKWLNRQEFEKFYQPSPAVIISRWSAFKREMTFMHDNTMTMIIDGVEGLDIDMPLDFFLIEHLMKQDLVNEQALRHYVKN